MRIAITGASGHLGRLTAEAVLGHTDATKLILVSRDPATLGDFAARGASVRRGDFNDPQSLPSALEGAERMLLISTDRLGERVAGHKAAVDAAARAGVRWLAYTSVVNPSDSNPVAAAGDHRATEEHVRASGMAWTFLRNSVYTETLLPVAAVALISGRHVANDGDGRIAYVSREDCAAAAAVVLTSRGHEGRAYDITGPEAVGARELAALFADLGGKPVEAVLVDDEAYVGALTRGAGVTEEAAREYATLGRAAREGYLAPVSTAVQDLTGRAPVTVRDVIKEDVAGAVIV
jgi:NAD(P)H dehydrogenase (quinone)